jgi:hypothetical protein
MGDTIGPFAGPHIMTEIIDGLLGCILHLFTVFGAIFEDALFHAWIVSEIGLAKIINVFRRDSSNRNLEVLEELAHLLS